MSTATGSLPTRVRKIDEDLTSLAVSVQEVQRVQQVHGEKLNKLLSDVDVIKTDVTGLKTDVADLKTDVTGLKTDIADLKTDVTGLKTDIADLKTGLVEVKTILGVIVSRLPER